MCPNGDHLPNSIKSGLAVLKKKRKEKRKAIVHTSVS